MKSFDDLCRDNYGRIYTYIFAMTGGREETEDLLQDVFTAAFEKGDGFLRHENPTAFLYRTARNLTLTYLKRLRRYQTQALDENIPCGEGDLLDEVFRARDGRIDETAYVGPVIEKLESGQQALYARRYAERRPIGEIAQEQGVSETALRMRLVRLRREIIGIVRELELDEI